MFETLEIKDVKASIGDLVKSYRKSRKLSQIELAELLDVSRNTIQNLESGKNFTIDTLFKVLKEFDLLQRVQDIITIAQKEQSEIKSLY